MESNAAPSPAVNQRPLAKYVADVCRHDPIRVGFPLPFGASAYKDGVNFALFSRHATCVWLEFFAQPDDAAPTRVFCLDPLYHRTGDVWHIFIQGVPAGQLYGYRIDGPHLPEQGHRFNSANLLLDPDALAVSLWPVNAISSHEGNAANRPKAIFMPDEFRWNGDRPLRREWSKMIIYETHVRGATIHPSSGVRHPGTYRGLTEKIPYLQELGITAVELMPVQEFHETASRFSNPRTGQSLTNYWGYDPIAFLAPKGSYSSSGMMGQQKLEFKEMVQAFHQAGIEVILDVVFTHTGEGDENGETLSLRGIDNSIFYMLEGDGIRYKNYTGTGNTINASHPVVRDYILSALRYWVLELHVDGFRFDLASVLGRTNTGALLRDPSLLERIAEDPILRETKLIAEAWDAAGAYDVGSFSTRRWAEWNGCFRDNVRRFWRGDDGMMGAFASRLCGSADIYARSGKGPECSINFVTCHDGFTLNDLVSYNARHNEENGESARDGMADNLSANYGVEGEPAEPAIENLRNRQIKNFILTVMVSRGVPMILGGDEFRRTQRGNNNAYCQDNETSWYDWSYCKSHRDILQFTKQMIAFRKAWPVLAESRFYADSEIRWFSSDGGSPDWNSPWQKALACQIHAGEQGALYLMFNASPNEVLFLLPDLGPAGWKLEINTNSDSPSPLENLPSESHFSVPAQSGIILSAT